MHLSGAERIEQGLEARFHFDRYGTSELVPCYEDSAVGEAEIPWADEGSGLAEGGTYEKRSGHEGARDRR